MLAAAHFSLVVLDTHTHRCLFVTLLTHVLHCLLLGMTLLHFDVIRPVFQI